MYCDMMTEIINQVALKPHTGPERDEVRENCIMKSFMICTAHRLLFRWSHQEE